MNESFSISDVIQTGGLGLFAWAVWRTLQTHLSRVENILLEHNKSLRAIGDALSVIQVWVTNVPIPIQNIQTPPRGIPISPDQVDSD